MIDGVDNFETRYLIADACEILGLPEVWGSVLRYEGQVAVFWSGHGPALRDLFPEPPEAGSVPSCAEGGVLGVLPGQIGRAMANEAIKLITGVGEPLLGRSRSWTPPGAHGGSCASRPIPSGAGERAQPRGGVVPDADRRCRSSP